MAATTGWKRRRVKTPEKMKPQCRRWWVWKRREWENGECGERKRVKVRERVGIDGWRWGDPFTFSPPTNCLPASFTPAKCPSLPPEPATNPPMDSNTPGVALPSLGWQQDLLVLIIQRRPSVLGASGAFPASPRRGRALADAAAGRNPPGWWEAGGAGPGRSRKVRGERPRVPVASPGRG